MRYNPIDNAYSAITFTLTKTLTGSHDILAFYNDHEALGDSYNTFRLDAATDTFSVRVKKVGVADTQVATVTTAGIGALLVAGANVQIRIRTRFYLGDPAGTTNIALWIDGVNVTNTTVPYGAMWTTGYGLVMQDIQCINPSVNSIESAALTLSDIK